MKIYYFGAEDAPVLLMFISQPTRPTDDASIKIRGINTINGSTDPISGCICKVM